MRLLRLDIRIADHLAPLRGFGFDERAELLLRVAHGFRAHAEQPFLDIRHAQYLDHFSVQTVTDIHGCGRGQHQREPVGEREARHEIVHRRHIGQETCVSRPAPPARAFCQP